MKLIGFDGGRVGITDANSVWDISSLSSIDVTQWPPVSALDLIARFDELRPSIRRITAGPPAAELSQVQVGPPVPWPSKLLAYPANYQSHVDEMNTGNRADVNGFFLKATSSLSAAGRPVVIPGIAGVKVHHECELAIVIGQQGRNIPLDVARSHIFGYAPLIDVTVRGAQERVMRKSFDTFCPMGPWVVTADEIPDPTRLDLELSVNGELRQQANTCDLIVGIDEMVSLASSVCTLYPGDVIASGTPGGVGPIEPGDEMTIRIQHVGEMSVPVVAGGPIRNRAFPAGAAVGRTS